MRVFRAARIAPFMLAAMVAVGGARAAAAQSNGDADVKEINAYRLSEAKLDKFMLASRNLVDAVNANPSITKRDIEKENPSLAEMAAFYDSHPAIKKAINSAGMTSREYVTFMLSIMQAGMLSWAAKQPGAKLPADAPLANIAFYDAHKEKIDAATKELRKLDQSDDEESDDAEDDTEEEGDEETPTRR